jgi:hypothetical protein
MRLNVDDKVEATVRSVGNKPVASLAESNLTQLIPADAEVAILDAASSAGDHLSGLLSRFEDRMATNSLKYEFGNRAREGQWLETMSTFYYSKLAAFRELVHTESLSVFEPPYAMLMGSKGDIDNLTVRFNSPEGKPNRVTIRDVPMLEYAVVARLKTPDKPLDFPAQVWTAFLSGVLDKSPEPSVTRNDLGLGEDTFTFDGSFWNKIPGKVQVSIRGDLLPHYFRLDKQWVVFSTSVRLSKRIIAAKNNGEGRFVLPENDGSQLIGFGRIPSGTVANFFGYLGSMFGDLFSAGKSVELEGDILLQSVPQDEMEGADDFFAGIAEVARLMDRVQWLTTQEEDVRTTRFCIAFVD